MKIVYLVFVVVLGYAKTATTGDFDCSGLPNGKYSNVENCSTFYNCSNSFTYINDCPIGLDFDSVSLDCNSPDEAKCAQEDECVGKGPGWWDGRDCNGHNHDDQYPDKYSCKHFYKCSWGKSSWFTCPSYLHFNKNLKVCDRPWNAGCQPECLQAATTTAPKVRCDGQGPGWWNGKDCNGHNHGDQYPDKYSCKHFYKCSWGKSSWFTCPSELHFNKDLKVCDWPKNAGCKPECPEEPTTAASTRAPTTAAASHPIIQLVSQLLNQSN